jgi:phage-related holin
MPSNTSTVAEWLKSVLFAATAFVAPTGPLLLAALVAVAFDSVTGVWAAAKRHEKISSAGFRRTITKGLIYSLAIISGYVIQVTLLADKLPISNLVAAAIGVTELKSILENCSSILGMPLFRAVMAKLGSKNDTRDVRRPDDPRDKRRKHDARDKHGPNDPRDPRPRRRK